MWIFHSSVCWWSFAGVWETASLLRSPGLFWVTSLSENQLLFEIILAWLASLLSTRFYPDLHHPISTFSLCQTAFKITGNYIFVDFSSSFLPLVYLSRIVFLIFFCIPEIRTANIHRILIGSLVLAIKRSPIVVVVVVVVVVVRCM